LTAFADLLKYYQKAPEDNHNIQAIKKSIMEVLEHEKGYF